MQPAGLAPAVQQFVTQGRVEEAINLYRHALEEFENRVCESPDDVAWQKRLLNANVGLVTLLRSHNAQDAAQVIAHAIDILPESAALYVERGRVSMALKLPDQAVPDFSRAIDLAPTDGAAPWWRLDRAQAFVALGRPDEALTELTQATVLWPKLWDAWVWRGNFHRDRAKWKDALADYTRALELNPKYVLGWSDRGQTHMRLGQWPEAQHDLEKAVELDPSGPRLNNLAWLLVTAPDQALWDPPQAIDLATRAIAADPKGVGFHNTLGVAYYRAGHLQEAIEALNHSISHSGETAFDYFFLAMAHWQLDQKNDAHNWFDKAVDWMAKNQPDNAELLGFRAEAEVLMKPTLAPAGAKP